MNKIKLVNQIIIGALVVILVTGIIGYYITSRIPKIPDVPKTIKINKIDAEKAGRKLRDLKNDFLRGYNDTTTIETDSIK